MVMPLAAPQKSTTSMENAIPFMFTLLALRRAPSAIGHGSDWVRWKRGGLGGVRKTERHGMRWEGRAEEGLRVREKETHLLFPLPRGTKFRNCHTHYSVSKCRSFELRATRSTSTCGLQVHGSFCVMSSVCVAFVGKGMNYELLATAGPLEPDEPATSGDPAVPPPEIPASPPSLPRPSLHRPCTRHCTRHGNHTSANYA